MVSFYVVVAACTYSRFRGVISNLTAVFVRTVVGAVVVFVVVNVDSVFVDVLVNIIVTVVTAMLFQIFHTLLCVFHVQRATVCIGGFIGHPFSVINIDTLFPIDRLVVPTEIGACITRGTKQRLPIETNFSILPERFLAHFTRETVGVVERTESTDGVPFDVLTTYLALVTCE